MLYTGDQPRPVVLVPDFPARTPTAFTLLSVRETDPVQRPMGALPNRSGMGRLYHRRVRVVDRCQQRVGGVADRRISRLTATPALTIDYWALWASRTASTVCGFGGRPNTRWTIGAKNSRGSDSKSGSKQFWS
jgi:hypothetical protein